LGNTVTVEQASAALQLANPPANPPAAASKVKSERSKLRKERDAELQRQRSLEQYLRQELDFTTHL